jgi:hypothetical protein
VRREYPNLNRQFHFIAFRQAAGDRLRSQSSDAAVGGLVHAAAGWPGARRRRRPRVRRRETREQS